MVCCAVSLCVSADPELYMALRISIEEERSRQQKGQEGQ